MVGRPLPVNGATCVCVCVCVCVQYVRFDLVSYIDIVRIRRMCVYGDCAYTVKLHATVPGNYILQYSARKLYITVQCNMVMLDKLHIKVKSHATVP